MLPSGGLRRTAPSWRLVDISVIHPRLLALVVLFITSQPSTSLFASRRLGRGALLTCHPISHWYFRCKCTALFSSASLRLFVLNMFALSDGGWSYGPWLLLFSNACRQRVLCYAPRAKLGSGPNERLSRRRQ